MKTYKLWIGLFLLVTTIISYSIFQSYQTLKNSYQKTESYILLQQQKSVLLNDMFNAARERSLILLSMLNEKDEFALDDLNQQLGAQARKFIMVRKQLLKLNLTPAEKKWLSNQRKLTAIVAPQYNQAAQLLIENKFELAKKILLNQAIPGQHKIFKGLDALIKNKKNSIDYSIKSLLIQLQKAEKVLVIELSLWLFSTLFLISLIIFRASQKESYRLISMIKERDKHLLEIEASKQVLQELNNRVTITFDAISDALITTQADGTIESLNPAAERLIDAKEADVINQYLPDLLPIFDEENQEEIQHPIKKVMESKKAISQLEPVILTCCDHISLAIVYTASPILNDQGELLGVVWVFHDMTEQMRLQKEVNYKALHDELTGLWNRYAFNKKLAKLKTDSDTFNSHHVLMYLDLDQFKIVNDMAGHIAGDELLKQITQELSLIIRKSDTLARLGGDEFGLLCENCDVENAMLLAEKIRAMIDEFQFLWAQDIFTIGVSIGVVTITRDSDPIEIMGKADMACYKAKENGRNRVSLFEENDEQLENRKNEMNWISKIETALEKEQFVLYSQKIASTKGDETPKDYREILIRLKDASGKIIFPDSFIPAAERFGLMWKIDQFVVDHSYAWLNQQPLGSVKLSVNLSGDSLGDADFLQYIEEKVSQNAQLNPYIIFEITETATIHNLRLAQDFMEKLMQQGIHFSLDDFGTGLSSFAYLKNMPVSYLKIDGIFVKNMDKDPVDAAMVLAVAQVAQTLGMKVVAEFVENEAILTKLTEMGITYAQGYHIEKPKPLAP